MGAARRAAAMVGALLRAGISTMRQKGPTDMITSARKPGRFTLARRAVAALAMFGLTLGPVAAQKKQLLEYPSIHSPPVGYHGKVVTQSEIASQVGTDKLRRGG